MVRHFAVVDASKKLELDPAEDVSMTLHPGVLAVRVGDSFDLNKVAEIKQIKFHRYCSCEEETETSQDVEGEAKGASGEEAAGPENTSNGIKEGKSYSKGSV